MPGKIICKTCGAELKADEEEHHIVCSYCGNSYTRTYSYDNDLSPETKEALAALKSRLRPEDTCVLDNYVIDLSDSPIEDDDLAEIKKIPELQSLILKGTKIGDKGIKHLSNQKNLTELDLSRTFITDESMKTIGQFKAMKYLDLSFTDVTDASLDILLSMNQLVSLNLMDTLISEDGLKRLKKVKPVLRLQ